VERGDGSDDVHRLDLRSPPHAATLKVAHPLMLRAIAAAKKKNDRIDASKICDWAKERNLPMLPSISFETGGKTQIQSSEQLQKAASANGSLVLYRIGTAAEKPHTRRRIKNYTRAPP
jgi:hypothetical protein